MRDEDGAEMARMYREGASLRGLAQKYKRPHASIRTELRLVGVTIRGRNAAIRMKARRTAKIDSRGYVRWGKTRVHRIVAEAWHGPPPSPKHVVDHIDSDKTNNHPNNLEWVTQSENLARARAKGRMSNPPLHQGVDQHCAKLSRAKVVDVRRRRKAGETWTSIARDVGVTPTSARSAGIGKTWAHVKDETPVPSARPAVH
jgi:hypothetical protein